MSETRPNFYLPAHGGGSSFAEELEKKKSLRKKMVKGFKVGLGKESFETKSALHAAACVSCQPSHLPSSSSLCRKWDRRSRT